MAIFTNQATLSYNNTTTTSNIVTGEIVEVLSAVKNALDTEYRFGDTVTYAISIINSGSSAFNNVTVTDNLGAYTAGMMTRVPLTYVDDTVVYYANGVLQTGATVTDASPLTITGINVPANGNVIVLYQARVNEFAPLAAGSVITNTATITGSGLTNPITVSDTITIASAAQLSITKSISPETVTENGQLTYTFVIQNTGNTAAAATDNVTVSDLFNPVLENITVSLNGTALVEGPQYTYDETTGLFQTVAGVITVPAATYTMDPTTGQWNIVPGVTVLTVTGTI
ncbi:MAG: hypothetical protein J6A77_00100 [Lachnospiraceae bacterium]|nr:hypothetical protein [Lachnospiraceae bacterium]